MQKYIVFENYISQEIKSVKIFLDAIEVVNNNLLKRVTPCSLYLSMKRAYAFLGCIPVSE